MKQLFIGGALLCWAAVGAAADGGALFEGDATAGQTKATACVACHGADGNSLMGEWPKLAGQHPQYIARQLALFKSGARENVIMLGLAAILSEEDMDDIAAFYATQELKPGVADEALVSLGGEVYRAGVAPRGVPACAACHGPNGKGNPLSGYPSLRGQHAQYIATTLRAFRDGAVWGTGDDANAVMAGVAANMSDAEIEAVASFIQGLY
ncbi:MAG: c-type cytochrome [Pseudomonadota bacterium]